MDYIEELRGVIRKVHGVESKHLRSVPVVERFHGKTVWKGEVEVFRLTGHPVANRAYAWAFDSPKRHYVAVLRIAPVTSPKLAVRAAIVQEFRNRGTAKES